MTATPLTPITPDDIELLSMTLQVSEDGQSWRPVVFEGEHPAFIDAAAAAYVDEHRGQLSISLDESTRWSAFPRTFDAVYLPEL